MEDVQIVKIKFIYDLYPKTPISVLHFFLELFVEDNNNIIDICKKINEKFNLDNVDNKINYDFISQLRHYITHYYKDIHIIEKFSNIGENRRFDIDELLFVHVNEVQINIIGLIDNSKFSRIKDMQGLKTLSFQLIISATA